MRINIVVYNILTNRVRALKSTAGKIYDHGPKSQIGMG